MGRHSAPEDEGDVLLDLDRPFEAIVATPTAKSRRGRHARDDDDPAGGRRPSSTAADLALLRHDRTLRARVAAAVIVPFALYTIVLLVVGATGVYLVWLAVPTVVAGVLAGALLDRAAKRAKAGSAPTIDR